MSAALLNRRWACALALLGWLLPGCSSTARKLDSVAKNLTGGSVRNAAYQAEVEDDAPPRKVKDPIRLKLSYAHWMEEMGHLPEARTHYTAILSEDEKCVEALLGLARLDERAGQHDAAEAGIHKALELDPNSSDARHTLGRLYAGRKRWGEAIEQLQQAMSKAPTDAQIQYDLAVALAQSGQTDQAMPYFNRTVGEAAAYFNIGLIQKEQNHLAQAEQQFLKALSLDPNLTQARVFADEVRRLQDPETGLAGVNGHDESSPSRQNETIRGVRPAGHQAVKIIPGAGHVVP